MALLFRQYLATSSLLYQLPLLSAHQMSSSSIVATAAEIRARVAFQKSERERLRAEEDAALEREVEEELARAEAVRFQAAEAARRREEALQQLAKLRGRRHKQWLRVNGRRRSSISSRTRPRGTWIW